MLRAMDNSKNFFPTFIGLFANSVARCADFSPKLRNKIGSIGGLMHAHQQLPPLPIRGSSSAPLSFLSSCFTSSCFSFPSPLPTAYCLLVITGRFPTTQGVTRGRFQGGAGGASGA